MKAISSRWVAASLHVAASVLIGGVVVSGIIFFWYPPPFLAASAGVKLISIILAVHMILGPTLTLIVYRPGKPGMKFDLYCIGLVQALALGYGLWVAADSRPAFIVVTHHRATLVHANEMHATDRRIDSIGTPGWRGPRLVYAAAPVDPEQRTRLLFEVLEGLPDAEYRPELFQAIDDIPPSFWASGSPLQSRPAAYWGFSKYRPHRLSTTYGSQPIESPTYLPLLTRNREMSLILEPSARRFIGIAVSP